MRKLATLLLLAAVTPLEAQTTYRPGPAPEPCLHERVGTLFSTEVARRSARLDDDAPTIGAARFLRDGRIGYTDFGLKNAGILDGETLETVLVIGREGGGPGEFTNPVDIAAGADGRLYVADEGQKAISIFTDSGEYLERLPTEGNPHSIVVADDGTVYYARKVVAAFLNRGLPLPIVQRIDPETKEHTTLLTATPDWLGKAPTYNAPIGFPMLRLGLDGELYVGFRQTAVIVRVDRDGEGYERVVEGCIPGALRGEYERPYSTGEKGRTTAALLADFAVFADGRVAVRGGLSTGSGGRVLDLYTPEGSWAHSILIEPGANYTAWGAINPWAPSWGLTWSPGSGEAKLLRFDLPRTDRFPLHRR